MTKIEFTKIVGSGNDFIIVEPKAKLSGLSALARKACDRRFGLGADGVLLIEKSKYADIRMRIFNADGSEADMCGNGARCAALYARRVLGMDSPQIMIETKAGTIVSQVSSDRVRVKLTEPRGLKLDIPIKINGRQVRANFINTGVPHAVIFVHGLDDMAVSALGRQVRSHPKFAPAGANADFVEVLGKRSIKLRTYERGVEDETLACGTGAVASAIVFIAKSADLGAGKYEVGVKTKSGETLKVYLDKIEGQYTYVWLEGKATIVAQGVYYV